MSKKRKETAEVKSMRAILYTHKYIDAAFSVMVRIYNTYDVLMMENFVGNLRFIHDLFREYVSTFFVHILYPNSIKTKRQTYYPLLLEMYQHDSHAMISDLISLGGLLELQFRGCTDIPAMNVYLRLSYTVCFFFESVKEKHPALHKRPPRNVKQQYLKNKHQYFNVYFR